MTFFFIVLLSLIALYLIGAYFAFKKACTPREEPDWDDPDGFSEEVYAKFSSVIPLARQWFTEHNAQRISIKSDDGLKLKGWWIPAENAKATMILVHGYHSTYYVDFSAVYELYHEQGFNLLLIDQRAQGSSDGKYITFGVKESRDLLRWIDYHNEHYGAFPTFLCGMSMGASTVLFAAGQTLPENIVGITADCGFTSPYEILKHVSTQTIGPMGKLLMPGARFWASVLAGFDMKSCDTRKTLQNCHVPLLLCHGLADDFVPCEMSRQAYNVCPGKKKLILVENAGHGVSFLTDPQRVQQELLTFIYENLPNKEENQ